MNDKELLELAAKAAGEKILPFHRGGGFCIVGQRMKWNPLVNDNDAFRLAVKLNFCITQWRNYSNDPPHVMVGYSKGPKDGANWIEDYNGDEMAANRRAIVSAAAEIGRLMP